MHRCDLSEQDAFIAGEGIEPDPAVSRHHNQLSVVVGKRKLSELMIDLDLVSENQCDRVIDVYRVPIVTHHRESLLRLGCLLDYIDT